MYVTSQNIVLNLVLPFIKSGQEYMLVHNIALFDIIIFCDCLSAALFPKKELTLAESK